MSSTSMSGSFSEQLCENAEVIAKSLLIVQVINNSSLPCQAVTNGNMVDIWFTP